MTDGIARLGFSRRDVANGFEQTLSISIELGPRIGVQVGLCTRARL